MSANRLPRFARASGDDLGGEPGGIESTDDPLRDVICTALDVQLIY